MDERVAIAGVGSLRPGRYAGRAEVELAVEVVVAALEDAGLGKDRVQGLFTTPDLRGSAGLQLNLLCERLRIRPRVAAETSCGAIAAGLTVRAARNEILLGAIDVAVCYGAEREASTGWFRHVGTAEGPPLFEPTALAPYGSPGTLWAYALSARRYMHETGATERDFALAAVRDRRNAVGSSHAALTRPITVDDVLGSPPLCTPLKLLDAPVSLDGAAAVVLVSERVARTLDVRPVWLTGLGEYHDDSSFVPTDGTDKPIAGFVSTTRATAEALEQAGIGLDDVDVAEIYAPFSSHELIIPEDMGFFGRGGMVEALATGATEIAGRIPINTDGGLLARGHPWAVTPFYETITIVRQIRGVMGASQVEGARTGLVHTEAGMLNDALVLILQGD